MGTFQLEAETLVGSDESLRIVFDRETGSIRQLTNLETTQELLPDENAPPWRLTPQGISFEGWDAYDFPPAFEPDRPTPTSVAIELDENGESARLRWETTNPAIEVTVKAQFIGSGELALEPRVKVDGDELPPQDFTYPILNRPRELSTAPEDDQLVYPAHSGMLFRQPLNGTALSLPYPDGFGCSMQFTAYLTEGVGGFYLATHDPHSTWKQFTFGADEWSVQHETWDLRPGTDLEYEYPIVIAAMSAGDWYEAADRYREWALNEPPWSDTSDRGAVDRDERRWLHEEVGLALWGAPSSLDWSSFYEFYADVAGTPLHICAGWDWPAERPHAVGREGWFPADFHPSNVEAWEGHHVTPYTNDLFISNQADDFLEQWEPNAVVPYSSFSFDSFSSRYRDWWPGGNPDPDPAVVTDVNYFLCSATEAQRDLHAWRASKMIGEYVLEGACYDISSGIPSLVARCWRSEHGHPPGRGRHLIQALNNLNKNTRAVTREETGEYLVQGVETVVENIIDSVDFHVSRAGSGPMGVLETWTPACEEPPGTGRELIPLFEAVYHDVGPVRHDGWLTLRDDQGDLWFWLAARIVLRWGGLLSLEYALQPPEQPPDGPTESELIDWGGATQHFDELPTPDPAKLDFVRELAIARTEFASEYLGHGRLRRPVPVEADSVSMDFVQHSLWQQMPGLDISGSWEVPAVVHGAWESPEGTVGLLFAAVDGTSRTVELAVDCGEHWGLDLANQNVTLTTRDSTEVIGAVSADNVLEMKLELDPWRVTLIQVGQ